MDAWRRARDSNPQAPKGAGFQDRCIANSASPPLVVISSTYVPLGVCCIFIATGITTVLCQILKSITYRILWMCISHSHRECRVHKYSAYRHYISSCFYHFGCCRVSQIVESQAINLSTTASVFKCSSQLLYRLTILRSYSSSIHPNAH